MRVLILFICTTVLVAISLAPATHPSAVAEAATSAQETPPPAPQGTSPARPDIEPPDLEQFYCHQCGAANPFPKKHYKGAMHRPMLARGQYDRAGEAYRKARHMRGREGRMGPGNTAARLLRHGDKIGLTDEQKTRLEDLAFQTSKDLIDLEAKARKEQLVLRKAIRDDAGMSQLERQLGAVSKARVAVEKAKLSCMVESKKILTDEQRDELKSMRHGMGEVLE